MSNAQTHKKKQINKIKIKAQHYTPMHAVAIRDEKK